jgi:gamma-glutamylcyclotransferase
MAVTLSTPEPILYFAYGSNLDREQMRSRCPGGRFLGCACLPGYDLGFGGYSRTWASAVATVALSPGARVLGGLYELEPEDLAALDDYEGHPTFYVRTSARISMSGHTARRAMVYRLHRHRTRPGKPSLHYLKRIAAAYDALGYDAAALLERFG